MVVALIGLGLAAAPAAFSMFERAPGGGDMLADFEPYMRSEKIEDFRADLSEIDAAHVAASRAVDELPADVRSGLVSTDKFLAEWPAIDDDMRSMLTTMEDNIGNYEGVNALPPFDLFPWFFVIPGVLLAALALWILFADRGRRPRPGRVATVVVVGVGLIAAPVVFGMFTRAPGGAEMIDEFKPFMTPEKVAEIQGYFLTIGGGEGEMRRELLPAVAAARHVPPGRVLPAVRELNRDWPEISGEMAPMVGTMADNVENFAGIAALPPFWLFPAFFALPGLLVAALGWRARRLEVAPIDVSAYTSQLSRRDIARALAASVAIVTLVAMGVMVIESGNETTTTTRRPIAARAPVPRPAPATRPAVDDAAARSVIEVLGTRTTRAAPSPVPPRSAEPPSPPPAPSTPDDPVPVPAPPPGNRLTCPLPLDEPPPGGGVASFTPLVPLFGPFSAEAFTMLPAFEPYFPLFGPMLVASEDFWAAAEPVLSQVVPSVNELEHAGFGLLEPAYDPYRDQFLAAEAEIAALARSVGEALVAIPGAGCLPALEALLLSSLAGAP